MEVFLKYYPTCPHNKHHNNKYTPTKQNKKKRKKINISHANIEKSSNSKDDSS